MMGLKNKLRFIEMSSDMINQHNFNIFFFFRVI